MGRLVRSFSTAGYIEVRQRFGNTLFLNILLLDFPALTLIVGFTILLWYVYHVQKLKQYREYIGEEMAALIAENRIFDRFPKRYEEMCDLAGKIRSFIQLNERQAIRDARYHDALLWLGILASAAVTIVGVLDTQVPWNLVGWSLTASKVSALLGIVIAALLTIQNTFRLSERARFDGEPRVTGGGWPRS